MKATQHFLSQPLSLVGHTWLRRQTHLPSKGLKSPSRQTSLFNEGQPAKNITAVFMSAEIYLIAMGLYCNIICSVNDKTSCNLNLSYGKNIFFECHAAFSCKVVHYIAKSRICLRWSVLDTELLVTARGLQIISNNFCGSSGHISHLLLPTSKACWTERATSCFR